MNIKFLVKLSNYFGILAILALIYWVFAFILIQVFGLRIFRANISEFFIFSVLGILALMASALMLNIMLNLTRLANSSEKSVTSVNISSKKYKSIFFGLILLFPLLAGGLFLGDYANTQKKQRLMQELAEQIIHSDSSQQTLQILGKIDNTIFDKVTLSTLAKHFAHLQQYGLAIKQVAIIMPDTSTPTDYLMFDENTIYGKSLTHQASDNVTIYKNDFIKHFSNDKNQYLKQAFTGENTIPLFIHHDGNFELFYPYQVDGKTVAVYYFTDYMQYGKY